MIWLIIRQIVQQDGSFPSYFFVYGAYIFSVNLWTRIPIKQKFIWSVSSARSALREMKKMWRQGDSLRMKLCLPPCAHTNVVTELWGIYSNVFCTHGVHCFSSSYQNLLRSESFALFRDFFQPVKASELTRNQNGMLHFVRTACLVCFLRNNQEKLYVKRHRCSFLSDIFILLKYNMKKSSWNLEQHVFCISMYFIDL